MKRWMVMAAIVTLLGAQAMAAETPKTLTERAAAALFAESDSSLATQLATEALKRNRHDAEAAFVLMEASAMQANDGASLDAALTVVTELDPSDARCELAIRRIEEAAGNTATFRARLLKVERLAHTMPELRFALVAAANDGVPELDQLESSREAGLVTDWKVAGPFGRHPLLDFDKHFSPEKDELQNRRSEGKTIERLEFPSGRFVLPEYFSKRGVYYAASDLYVVTDGMWNLYMETGGTAAIYVDGALVSQRDERKAEQPELIRKLVHLTQGHHRLLMKFSPTASPFRVALLLPSGGVRKKQNIPVLRASPESDYALAALELSDGNPTAAMRDSNGANTAAIFHWLLARSWKKTGDDAPEQETELRTALNLDSSSAAVRLALADARIRAGMDREGLGYLKDVANVEPHNERVLHAEVVEFAHLGWDAEATGAIKGLVEEHPSCANLRLAAGYYASTEQLEEAQRSEAALAGCAPLSLEEARAFARRGDHKRAAQIATKVAYAAPNDRDALALATQESMLTGDAQAAFPLAAKLAELAPGSERYQQWFRSLQQGKTALDFDKGSPLEVLAPYRRDALEAIRQTASRKFAGGPAVWSLNDGAVVELNGTSWLYTHRVVRLLDRDGVLNYGEVVVPSGAEILHLRTISPAGEITEPDITQHKATVSMPALMPGDSIEEEFLRPLGDEEARFEFGSWDAPVLLSRFTWITAKSGAPEHSPFDPAAKKLSSGLTSYGWESNDLAQPVREAALPAAPQFPYVAIAGSYGSMAELRDHQREQILENSTQGPRTIQVVRRSTGATEVETARNLYQYVMRSMESDGSDGPEDNATSAEDSLAGHSGNRVTTLLALARAAGLSTELLDASTVGADPGWSSMRHPVVVFRFKDGTSLAADLGQEGLPLGSLDPTLELAGAMPVMGFAKDTAVYPEAMAETIAASKNEERSVANARIQVAADGMLKAEITITMAPWRAAQMRNVLRGVSGPDRHRFFQQLAMRIFPGVSASDGTVSNENDPERPLTLHVSCTSPGYFDLRRHTVDIDQLTPALGLRSMYAKTTDRRYPLLIDSVLFESTIFNVTLPEGMVLSSGLQSTVESKFGSYSTSIRQTSAHTWEMRRDFHVPVQIVPSSEYAAFSAFANRIDSVERQRLTLRVEHTPAQPVSLRQPHP